MDNIRKQLTFTQAQPAKVSRSVFHADPAAHHDVPVEQYTAKPVPDMQLLLHEYINVWSRFEGAGPQFLEFLSNGLRGTNYETFAAGIQQSRSRATVKGNLNVDMMSIAKEIEFLLQSLGRMDPVQGSQMLVTCILLLLKMESHYHQVSHQAILSQIKDITHTCARQNYPDVLQQMQNFGLLCQIPPPAAIRNDHKIDVKPPESPKQAAKAMKGSFFSLFTRKNSPDEGKSSFYVDAPDAGSADTVNQSNTAEQKGSQSGVVTHGGGVAVETNESIQNKETAGLSPHPPAPRPQGHLATEEELDSVISLLTGVSVNNPQMAPQMPTMPPGGAPPSMAPFIGAHGLVNHGIPKAEGLLQTRQTPLPHQADAPSELLNLNNFGNNTWPNQQRPSLPMNAGYGQPFYVDTSHDGIPQFPAVDVQTQAGIAYPGGGQFPLQYSQWGLGDGKMGHTWPVAGAGLMVNTGSDTMASSWSGVQDSSDLSDDSSNEEEFFNVDAAARTKNYSSDEEAEKKTYIKRKDKRPRSMENLLEAKSTYTWPPKHPWARSSLVVNEVAESATPERQHRPLQMHWSDPMSSRNIWSAPGMEGLGTTPIPPHSLQHPFGPHHQ